MKRILIALLLALLGLLPIQAADAGTTILSAPQSYLDEDLNSDALFPRLVECCCISFCNYDI